MKITSPSVGLAVARAEIREGLRAGSETHGRGAGHQALVEHRDRQAVADRHEVADVDERVDGRDRALLGEAAQQRLGGRAIGGRVDAEGAERRRQAASAGSSERRVSDPGKRCLLLRPNAATSSAGEGPFETAPAWTMPPATERKRSATSGWYAKRTFGMAGASLVGSSPPDAGRVESPHD